MSWRTRKTNLLTQKSHISNVISRLEFRRDRIDRIADTLTAQFGSTWFLMGNAVLFVGWIEWNIGVFGFEPFDPFPFGLLTMIVSLEAIFLSIFVLMSQNRQGQISDIRQQIDFEIDVRAEAEVKKIMHMLEELRAFHGIGTGNTASETQTLEIDLNAIQMEIEENSHD